MSSFILNRLTLQMDEKSAIQYPVGGNVAFTQPAIYNPACMFLFYLIATSYRRGYEITMFIFCELCRVKQKLTVIACNKVLFRG